MTLYMNIGKKTQNNETMWWLKLFRNSSGTTSIQEWNDDTDLTPFECSWVLSCAFQCKPDTAPRTHRLSICRWHQGLCLVLMEGLRLWLVHRLLIGLTQSSLENTREVTKQNKQNRPYNGALAVARGRALARAHTGALAVVRWGAAENIKNLRKHQEKITHR